jgi:hypothetical protein
MTPELWTPPRKLWTPSRSKRRIIRAGFVQGAVGTGSAAPSSVSTANFAGANTLGNFIGVGICSTNNSDTVNSVSDTAGNTTWTLAGHVAIGGNPIWLYYAWNIKAAGANTNKVTANVTAGGFSSWGIFAIEESGVQNTSDPKRVANTAGNNFGSSTDPTCSLAGTSASDTIIAVVYNTSTPTAGSPLVLREQVGTVASLPVTAMIEDGTLAGGTVNPFAGPATTIWNIVAAAFIAAPAAPSGNAIFYNSD